MNGIPRYEQYRAEWLLDVTAEEPTSVQLGNRFSHKLVTQWLDLDHEFSDVNYCDRASDGGIDVALLLQGQAAGSEAETPEGDTRLLNISSGSVIETHRMKSSK